ncbi:putative flagellar attachment zone protein [Leptomonas pyrrhocoris]|uniref:Putative flagellar attachment zone protein n=1 Tax=Leptomonas pyrrhocoris TaxID=157538 RepID=A0A0N0DWV8_LEPPY|nr:putative flagellar attachment zone protein [Leptomonas pyrrhocoris]XP_015660521.1 putative flagellar attachment zone protein [Leptomonas pyrrhocoris]KPA82081.1 putative flagellar attachment zone protein [Leptomonas pyrrhocoris]KPA82082.1 putative flagellar attachment zone protein [Leptomonas pyrrhocoris]|eukprot:XP_015660520.1 putative flagellar attachment zone protein [Leptomonas pyrrhocoris]
MLANYISPTAPPAKVGQVVAYDYLYNNKTWQWTLGTVREINEYTATVQQWGLHTGDADTLRSILSREVDGEGNRMKSFQDSLALARDALASTRRNNEDRVSAVRDRFDKARGALELIDEVDLRKVTVQAAPSPVAVAVLKSALSVAKCDPTAVEFYEWADVQVEYRKPNALDSIIKTDVVAKLYPSPDTLLRTFEQDPKLNYKAASRDSPVVASLHAWVTTALAYQQAYNNLNNDKSIQEHNDAIGAAIAGMKACRAKIATLKDELAAKKASARPEQVTSFAKTSVLVPIPLSTVICPVDVDGKVEGCVLTNDEVTRILADAKATRYQQKQQMCIVVSRLLQQYATATTTDAYAKELEERLFFLQHCYGGALRDAQTAAKEDKRQLDDLAREVAAHRQRRYDAKQARAKDPALAAEDDSARQNPRTSGSTGSSRRTADGPAEANNAKPRGTESQERAFAATQPVSPEVIAQEPLLIATANELQQLRDEAEKLARAAADLQEKVEKLDKKLAQSGRECDDSLGKLQAALDELDDRKEEADKLAAENAKMQNELEQLRKAAELADDLKDELAIKDADLVDKDAELAAHRQKRHDAKKARSDDPELAAADNAGRQPATSRNRQRPANAAKDCMAGSRGGATHRHEEDPASVPVDPAVIQREQLYAVTLDEYKEKDAAGKAAVEEAEKLLDELNAAKHQEERLSDELAEKDAELAAFRQKRQDAKDARAADPELAAADGADAAAARDGAGADNKRPKDRSGAKSRPDADAKTDADADAASKPVDPAVIAEEPLYVATADELQQLRDDLQKAQDDADKLADDLEQQKGDNEKAADDAEKLADELAKAQEEAEKLADELAKAQEEAEKLADELAEKDAELAAFRQKRQDAKDARAADPELAAADGADAAAARDGAGADNKRPKDRSGAKSRPDADAKTDADADAASKPVDPAVIAEEPLYVATADELQQLRDDLQKAQDDADKLADDLEQQKGDNEKAADDAEKLADELAKAQEEAEKLADELAKAQEEAEKLADELAEKDAELAAFRQKRQDAKDARAADPELAAADGADAAAARDGAGADNKRPKDRSGAKSRPDADAKTDADADAASKPVDPAVIAEEPLYVATADELQQLRDKLKDNECELAAAKDELEAALAGHEEQSRDVAGENDTLRNQLDELDDANKKLAKDLSNAEDEKQRLCDDLEAALDDLEQKKDDYEQLLENLEQVEGLLEASKASGRSAVDALEQRNLEMADLQDELAEALEACKENERLRAELEAKDKEFADLMRHNELWRDPAPAEDAAKAKVTHRFTKIFDGDWTRLIQQRPEALMTAFVTDSSNACHVPGDQINQVAFDHD